MLGHFHRSEFGRFRFLSEHRFSGPKFGRFSFCKNLLASFQHSLKLPVRSSDCPMLGHFCRSEFGRFRFLSEHRFSGPKFGHFSFL